MKPTPQIAIARPRWWKGKISQRIACESGMIGPPPRPWKMRATISVVRLGAIPERNELTTKSVAQIRKNRLRPNNPASHPVAGMITALAARYEVITHETSSSPADREPCRCGRMTLVTLVSRICMKATTMTVKVIAHFCTGEIGASDSGGVIAGVLLGVRPKVGEPLVVGHGESVVARLAVRDRVRRHRYGELHRRETVGAQHERLSLAQYRQGEPWDATQTRSEDYDTSHLARGGSVQSVGAPCRA